MLRDNSRSSLSLFVVAGLLFGTLAGFGVGHFVTEQERRTSLQNLAQQFIVQADQIADEALLALATINKTAATPCSDGDLAFLRQIVVNSRFLKNAGRQKDGQPLCSVLLDRVDGARQLSPPDFVGPNGRAVRTDSELAGIPGARGMTVTEGSAEVVIGTRILKSIADPRLSYILAIDLGGQRHILSSSTPPPPTPDGPLRTGVAIVMEGQRYQVACSSKLIGCVSVRLLGGTEGMESGTLIGFALMGALAGMASGAALSARRERHISLENRLRLALRANEISVVYQPVKRIISGETTGFEVLARWQPPGGGDVPPDLFIAAAEQGGFIVDVTRYIVHRALTEMAPILRQRPHLTIAVNVAAEDLLLPSFADFVGDLCNFHALPRHCLSFELTERSTAKRHELGQCITLLRAAGHRIYIDDFGVEYSNLSYLVDLHVDAVKLDRSFTSSVGKGGNGEIIAAQIADMVASLNVDLVAEGIETREQADYFGALSGNIRGQGWLFGKPMKVAEVESHLG